MVAVVRTRTSLIAFIVASAVAAIVVVNWQWVSLSAAALVAERRPALLRDARWDDVSSAREFQRRFRRGVPERELVTWLTATGFEVGPPAHASKVIGSLPCNEKVNVDWVRGPLGELDQATAQVLEAGCL